MHKIFIAALLLSAVSISAAAAQAPAHGPGAMLAAADANHDGAITRAEFDAAHAARFAQMDANHDGSLSADEHPQQMGPAPPGQPPAADGGAHHQRGDANGDGVISRAEFDAQGAAMFDHLDANHDGAISQAEVQAMHDAMHH